MKIKENEIYYVLRQESVLTEGDILDILFNTDAYVIYKVKLHDSLMPISCLSFNAEERITFIKCSNEIYYDSFKREKNKLIVYLTSTFVQKVMDTNDMTLYTLSNGKLNFNTLITNSKDTLIKHLKTLLKLDTKTQLKNPLQPSNNLSETYKLLKTAINRYF